MDNKVVSRGYFVTYVSTSWRKKISEMFMKGKGMIIHFDENFRNNKYVRCCNVSCISPFPDECEVLFSRSTGYSSNNFTCEVLDECNGVQTVSLKRK